MPAGFKMDWFSKEVEEKIKDIVHAVSREGANMIAKDARSLCPWETGELATSIKVKKSKFEDGGFVVHTQGSSDGKYHASFVELGYHSSEWGRHKKGSKAGVYVPAQPFLRPAMHKNKRKVHRMYQEAIDKL